MEDQSIYYRIILQELQCESLFQGSSAADQRVRTQEGAPRGQTTSFWAMQLMQQLKPVSLRGKAKRLREGWT